MMHSLRTKLVASHILPILLLIPILSLYLFYVLEEFFSTSLLQQLTYQANLVSSLVEQNPGLVEDHQAMNDFLSGVARWTDARVVILSKDNIILTSTDATDADRIGMRYSDAAVEKSLRGETAHGIGPGFTSEVAYVVFPLRREGVIIGAFRLPYGVKDLRIQFSRLQGLVLGGAVLTILLGLGLGVGLATTITRPLRQLNERKRTGHRGRQLSRQSDRARPRGRRIGAQFQSNGCAIGRG